MSPDKQIWHDFSSNKGGDVFSFVMEVEGMDFRASLEHLARKAGVDLSLYDSKSSQQLAARKKRLYEAHRLAARYYQRSLLSNHHAMEYVFARRGLNKKVVHDFAIGYAPDSGNALVVFLLKKNFTKKELSDAGLTNRYGGDMFRGRMVLPLMDTAGQIIGFTARIIADVPDAPKYLNTSQTLLYDKSRHIFGLSQAKESIRKAGYVVIVEGNIDVVSSHQVGVCQVVATAGTAMTEHHIRALKRLTDDVRLAYDGDVAGVAATERAIGLASSVGVNLAIVSLPGSSKDPDELIRQDATAWSQAIEQKQPAVDWVLAQYCQREDLTTAAGKRAFTTAALNVVRQLDDPVEKDHYVQKIAEMTGSSSSAVVEKLTQDDTSRHSVTLKPMRGELVQSSASSALHQSEIYQDNALAIACLDPASQELFAHIDSDYMTGEERQAVARYFAAHHDSIVTDTPDELAEYDTYVKILLLKADARYAGWDDKDRFYETARLIRYIENEHKKQTRAQLTVQLREAELADDEQTALRLREKLNTLIKEIARGQR